MAASPIARWFAVRFLPLSGWDYAAIVAAVVGLVREVFDWLG
jgi:hypothetical protein